MAGDPITWKVPATWMVRAGDEELMELAEDVAHAPTSTPEVRAVAVGCLEFSARLAAADEAWHALKAERDDLAAQFARWRHDVLQGPRPHAE